MRAGIGERGTRPWNVSILEQHSRAPVARTRAGRARGMLERQALEVLQGEVAISNLARLVKPEHLAPLAPIDDVRASADYREEAALVVVRRLLAELTV